MLWGLDGLCRDKGCKVQLRSYIFTETAKTVSRLAEETLHLASYCSHKK